MKQTRLNYNEAIDFILDNFSSNEELIALLNKYSGGSRFPNLGEVDKIMYSNIALLSSITGEITSGKLDLFNKGLSIDQLKFWVARHYPTPSELESLLELYTSGGKLDDVHQDLVVVNNFDNLTQLYQDMVGVSDEETVNQVNEVKGVDQMIADSNEQKLNLDSSRIKLFDEEPSNKSRKTFTDIPVNANALDILQATLQRVENNFKEMHWNVRGTGFKGIHEIFGEVYDKLTDYLDELIELRMSNDEVFDTEITTFIVNSSVAPYDINSECPYEKSVQDINSLLSLCLTEDDKLVSDLVGRLITELNHYKYLIKGYHKGEVKLDIKDDSVVDPENEIIVEEISENPELETPVELSVIKQYCTNKRQAKCFNELMSSFKKDEWCVFKDKSEGDYFAGLKSVNKTDQDYELIEDGFDDEESAQKASNDYNNGNKIK